MLAIEPLVSLRNVPVFACQGAFDHHAYAPEHEPSEVNYERPTRENNALTGVETVVETMVEQVQRLLDERLPKCDHHGEVVELITDQQVRLRLPYRNDFAGKDSWQGQSIPIFSGPTVFSLCDTAMFACVIAFCGPCVSPVMINSSISYISPAKQNDLLANAEIVRTGRNIGHLQCSVVCPEEDAVRAKATASYKLIHNSTDQQVTHA